MYISLEEKEQEDLFLSSFYVISSFSTQLGYMLISYAVRQKFEVDSIINLSSNFLLIRALKSSL